jgi:hypothetical protein
MTDVATMLGYVSALMELEAGGVPVHMLVNLALAVLVTFRVLMMGYRGSRAAVRYVFSRRKDPLHGGAVAPDAPLLDEELPSWPVGSAPFQEAMEALACRNPEYDAEKHHLHCEGLLVVFSGEFELPNVLRTLACPSVHPTGEYVGVKLDGLVSEQEKALIYDHARELRLEVIRRDREAAGEKAALAMRHERLKHRLNEMQSAVGLSTSSVMHAGPYDGPEQRSDPVPSRMGPVPTLNRPPVKSAGSNNKR